MIAAAKSIIMADAYRNVPDPLMQNAQGYYLDPYLLTWSGLSSEHFETLKRAAQSLVEDELKVSFDVVVDHALSKDAKMEIALKIAPQVHAKSDHLLDEMPLVKGYHLCLWVCRRRVEYALASTRAKWKAERGLQLGQASMAVTRHGRVSKPPNLWTSPNPTSPRVKVTNNAVKKHGTLIKLGTLPTPGSCSPSASFLSSSSEPETPVSKF